LDCIKGEGRGLDLGDPTVRGLDRRDALGLGDLDGLRNLDLGESCVFISLGEDSILPGVAEWLSSSIGIKIFGGRLTLRFVDGVRGGFARGEFGGVVLFWLEVDGVRGGFALGELGGVIRFLLADKGDMGGLVRGELGGVFRFLPEVDGVRGGFILGELGGTFLILPALEGVRGGLARGEFGGVIRF